MECIKKYALSQIYGEGEKITAVILAFDKPVCANGTEFEIDGRTIETVVSGKEFEKYMEGREDLSEYEKRLLAGQSEYHILIKLSDGDKNAGTIYENAQAEEGPGGRVGFKETALKIKMHQEIKGLEEDSFFEKEFIVTEKRQPLAEKFETSIFELPDGRHITYNLYKPEGWDQEKKYPLVIFLEDAGVLSLDPGITLCQGLGAVVWTTPQEQKKHSCFVLAPQFPGPKSLVEDDFSYTWEVQGALELLKYIIKKYPIDSSRVYGTGQSMGCMTLCKLNSEYPDLFAGCLLVGGQWDPEVMKNARKGNFWISVSKGDEKAFPGMNAVTKVFEDSGELVGREELDALEDPEVLNGKISELAKDGNHIHYTWFKGDSVIPEGEVPTPIAHHKNTWRVTYQLEALRDWLFAQKK